MSCDIVLHELACSVGLKSKNVDFPKLSGNRRNRVFVVGGGGGGGDGGGGGG